MSVQLPVFQPEKSDRFARRIERARGAPLRAGAVTTLQINVGKVCNQACKHCHVDAGPARTEAMDTRTASACIDVLARGKIATLDITGGAPELNANFRWMVERARALGAKVIVRHNLTVQFEPMQSDLPEFFAANDVEVVSSLPHFDAAATDRQRGGGVFEKSIAGIRRLNALGYGQGDPRRVLALVHNPVGAFLPGSQSALLAQYRTELGEKHHVTFDALYVLTNMPIQRFKHWLERTGQREEYEQSLEDAFNPATIDGLMCRSTLSVSWDGGLYDCDFNQMLELEVAGAPTIFDVDLDALVGRRVATAEHCFGCTAGSGSSCGGQLT
ncbi:MAG: arsenosugar biosynthesis radical SAM protein ArsS [Myxococcales bacterium]|nr:arsenosugar biosynthesis radical SAM protein ArsS [Myxococcales bacterium]